MKLGALKQEYSALLDVLIFPPPPPPPMGRLVDKFWLYARHMKEIIDTEKNSKTKTTVKGKLKRVLDAQVAFLKYLLTPAKVFSLV